MPNRWNGEWGGGGREGERGEERGRGGEGREGEGGSVTFSICVQL